METNGAQSAQELRSAVERRTDLDISTLAELCKSGGLQLKVRRGLMRSLFVELKRRFKLRPKQADGTRELIDGAKSFSAWLERHGIPKRNVYYILNGRKTRQENGVSVHLTSRECRYLLLVLKSKSDFAKELREKICSKL